jgi:hypothetical protein
MSDAYLVKLEFQRVQTFLFAIPRLADIVGANALLGEMLRYELPKLAKECGCSAPPDLPSILKNTLPDDPLSKDEKVADKPYQQWSEGILARDGGHFRAYFADKTQADGFEKQARSRLREKLPSLRFEIELKAVKDIHEESKPKNTVSIMQWVGLPCLQPCEELGNGVAVERIYRGKDKRDIGLLAQKRKQHWDKFKYDKTEDIAAVMTRQLKLQKAETFEDLCNGDYLALIHADGNGLGNMQKDLMAACKSKGIEGLALEAEIEMFFYTMRVTLRRALKLAIEKLEQPQSQGIQILMLGGDDLLIACRAPLALPLVSALANELHELQRGKTPQLTIGVGVAIAKPSFPFHRLHDLAEELASSAKRSIRHLDEPVSVVDWAICSTAWHGDLKDMRRLAHYQQYTVQDKTETLVSSLKPYRLLPADGQADLQTLLDHKKTLDETKAARSQLRQLVRSMAKGKRQVDSEYQNLKIASPKTWASLQAVNFGDSLWQGDTQTACYRSRFADLVEVWEIDNLHTEKTVVD